MSIGLPCHLPDPAQPPTLSFRPVASPNPPSRAGLEALPLGHAEPCTHLDGIGNSDRHHLPGAEGQAEWHGHPRTHAQLIDHRLRIRGVFVFLNLASIRA